MQYTQKPTILQILPALNTGGVERGAVDLAIALKDQGFRPVIASSGGTYVQTLLKHQIPHYSLPLQKKSPLAIWRNSQALAKIISKLDISILHARSRAPAWAGYFAAKATKIPFVTTFHGTYGLKGGSLKKLYNSVMVRGQVIIAISHHIAQHIRQHYSLFVSANQKIQVIYRSVDVKAFSPESVSPQNRKDKRERWDVSKDSKVILIPGRLSRWKGQLTVLKAASKVHTAECVFVFVGDDQGRKEYTQEILQNIQDLNLENKVRLVGNEPDMPTAYAAADLVIHASLEPEAFGRVIIEAQAMKKPVIASQLGAPCEIIEPQVTGWLVPPGDSDALARQIDTVFSQPKTSLSIAQKGYEKCITTYSLDRLVKETVGIYTSLI